MDNHYQLLRIHNYINGLMSSEDMHLFEREALNDPFLQDAIDGYTLQHGVNKKHLSLLQQRLQKRVVAHESLKNKQYFSWQRLTIGALSAVLFISVCILFLIRYLPKNQGNHVTQVELMKGFDASFRIKPLKGSNAEPIIGWEKFEEYLSLQIFTTEEDRTFVIYFDIDQAGQVQNLRMEDPVVDTMLEELTAIFKGGTKWKGEKGILQLSVFP
ncbi:hypothetical protein ORI89_02270 [Sphingobacterium sp. UT-1RO-CII-1]|uniref:hypothetical protein n=1 Tax=Sphingobacterium sp. UT-1RO-CII-1 TaxID=2995225 RepID=UPI00227CD5CA|nr:hypothetical protein [Sphingobacterium sp. UT-1RO-CII-1]MCY4778461.1 hypothetical protein [Sphingobacterium sp. UT-1RO-CII-1]